MVCKVSQAGYKASLIFIKNILLFLQFFLNQGLLNYSPLGQQGKQRTQSIVKIASRKERRHEKGKDTNVRLRHSLTHKKKKYGIAQSSSGYTKENLGELWVMWLNCSSYYGPPADLQGKIMSPRKPSKTHDYARKLKTKTTTYTAPQLATCR